MHDANAAPAVRAETPEATQRQRAVCWQPRISFIAAHSSLGRSERAAGASSPSQPRRLTLHNLCSAGADAGADAGAGAGRREDDDNDNDGDSAQSKQ